MSATSSVRVDVHLGPEERMAALEADARTGLLARPKELSPKWFYDERGSQLFDEITRLPEYYLTGCERQILAARTAEIAGLSGADTLVELGSGTSEKTRLLLDALAGSGRLRRFVPFDVSEATLRESAAAIADEYADIEVHALVGDFERHLGLLPRGGRRLVAFLGSSIGNLAPASRERFLRAIAAELAPGDSFLLGVDLVKDVDRLEAAYNDAAGVTAEFNRNVLRVLDNELGADFDPAAFEHVARFDPEREWIEMLLRARAPQRVRIAAIDLEVEFEAGEEMRTEISAKFRRDRLASEFAAAGLTLGHWWTDESGSFALVLALA